MIVLAFQKLMIGEAIVAMAGYDEVVEYVEVKVAGRPA
jgi:hypothetical protein